MLHGLWMESGCHDHQAGMGCMKHDIWCEGCMYVGRYGLHVVAVKKARMEGEWFA
jgi:hypothetical protein